MKFSTSLLAAALILGASAAYAGSDDGTVDNRGLPQTVTSQPAAAASAITPAKVQTAAEYHQFEHQAVRP